MGAMYHEGSVRVALEYMDMGDLKSVMKLARKKYDGAIPIDRPIIPEAVCAKIF